MKKKELLKLKEKNKKELHDMVKQNKIEVMSLIGNIYAGKEKNLKKARNLKKEIAQILTFMKEKGNK